SHPASLPYTTLFRSRHPVEKPLLPPVAAVGPAVADVCVVTPAGRQVASHADKGVRAVDFDDTSGILQVPGRHDGQHRETASRIRSEEHTSELQSREN